MIVFSDKSCAFPNSGDLGKDWRRWYRRAIRKSAEQVFGAERWLRKYPDRVFLDSACSQRFPLDLDQREFTFHRVVVALGAKDACQRHLGGSGSLVIQPDLVGDDHASTQCHLYSPFRVGHPLPRRGYVHVFDDVSLDVVLRERDTVTDFIRYLTDKEELLSTGKLFVAAGEEDLLAAYLSHHSRERGHHFDVPSGNVRVEFDNTWWRRFASSDEYRRKKEADRPSYLWDSIIREFAQHVFDGTLLPGSLKTLDENERLVRVLAQENRLSRRNLGEALADQQRRAEPDKLSFRTIISSNQPDVAYVSLLFPRHGEDSDDYRALRRATIENYCFVLAEKRRQHKQVVGLATEAGVGEERSFDLCLFEPGEWTPKMEQEAKQIQSKLQILKNENLRRTNIHQSEYPKAPHRSLAQMSEVECLLRDSTVARATGRNQRCPCGSGRKFKQCCGRPIG